MGTPITPLRRAVAVAHQRPESHSRPESEAVFAPERVCGLESECVGHRARIQSHRNAGLVWTSECAAALCFSVSE